VKLKDIIKKPIITEKSISQTAVGEYTFAVDRLATKGQIKQAVRQFFGVDVVRVRTITIKGKTKRVGKLRKIVRLSDWKKAIVKLKEGQKIKYFETGDKK